MTWLRNVLESNAFCIILDPAATKWIPVESRIMYLDNIQNQRRWTVIVTLLSFNSILIVLWNFSNGHCGLPMPKAISLEHWRNRDTRAITRWSSAKESRLRYLPHQSSKNKRTFTFKRAGNLPCKDSENRYQPNQRVRTISLSCTYLNNPFLWIWSSHSYHGYCHGGWKWEGILQGLEL